LRILLIQPTGYYPKYTVIVSLTRCFPFRAVSVQLLAELHTLYAAVFSAIASSDGHHGCAPSGGQPPVIVCIAYSCIAAIVLCCTPSVRPSSPYVQFTGNRKAVEKS